MAEKDEDIADEEKKEGEEGAEGEGAEGEGGKKSKKKLIIIIAAAVVVVLGGVGAAGYFMGWFGGSHEEAAATEEGGGHAEGEHGETGEAATGQPVYYEMPEMLVNLNTGGKQASFLKMKITLELADPKDVQVIETHMPHITDAFNTYLRELRASDLAGSAGLYRLKEELLLRVNNAIQPSRVKNILFRDILIQ